MKKIKFYLMALIVAMVAFTSCGDGNTPNGGDNPNQKEEVNVDLKMTSAIYYTNYEAGAYEHYVLFFEDKGNAENTYYAELVSFGNEKQGPTVGKYTIKEDLTEITGDLLISFSKTIVEEGEEVSFEAETATFEIKSAGEIVISATYTDGTSEKLTWKDMMPQVIDFPGQGEDTEVKDYEWTATSATVELNPTSLGEYTLTLLDEAGKKGAIITGFAGRSWMEQYDEATGTSSLSAFPASQYHGMKFMDFYNMVNVEGQIANVVFYTDYADYMNQEGYYCTVIFDGVTADGSNFEKMWWQSNAAMVYAKENGKDVITYQAMSYHGSYFSIVFEGELKQEIVTGEAQAAPKKLAPRAQTQWGTMLINKKALVENPEVKIKRFPR